MSQITFVKKTPFLKMLWLVERSDQQLMKTARRLMKAALCGGTSVETGAAALMNTNEGAAFPHH